MHAEHITIYYLLQVFFWIELLTCAETGKEIERREGGRHLVVLALQLVPSIEGPPRLLFLEEFDFSVQHVRLQNEILQSFCGLLGLVGVGDGDGSWFDFVR